MKTKKVLFLLPMFLGLFIGSLVTNNEELALAEDTKTGESYIIDSFATIPDNWSMNSACDLSHTAIEAQNNELLVSHSGTNGGVSNFYGFMSTIAEDYTFEDFTFTMRFKMISAENTSRWFGIAYHTQGTGATTKGYLMNYRQDGTSAASAFVKGSFVDEAKVDTGVPLNDNQYHTIKIVMDGSTSRHYIDNNLITSWDVNIKNTTPLGVNEYLASGGFSLIVNRSVLSIQSVSISPVAERVSDDEKQIDNDLVSTYRWNSSLINFPTVVAKINSQDALTKINETSVKPSNVILRMDQNANIVDDNNSVIDTFYNVYVDAIKKQAIPVIHIETQAEGEALASFLKTRIDILDLAVMSSNADYIMSVRQNNTKIRGILLATTDNLEMYSLVKRSQECGAATIILPQELATMANVTFLQARFKTVWVEAASIKDMDLYQSINSGAMGIVTSDYEKVYQTYEKYDANATTRAGFNVAHRGLTNSYNENSLSGMAAAIEKGATHLEIDCYLTTDQEIVIMHDADISRTTNGSGNIESYSLAELREFKLDVYEPYEDIPTLDDVISLVANTDVVIVLEVKSAKGAIVGCIRNKLTQYDCYDQVVSISFNRDILGLMKRDLKEVPIAFLGAVNTTNIADKLVEMGQYHYVFDTDYSNTSREFNEYYLRDRGITGWYWTFDNTAKTELVAIANGYVGITNNVAERFAKKVQYIVGQSYQLQKDEDLSSLINLDVLVHFYDGSEEKIAGEIFAYEDQGEYYNVICRLEVGSTISGGRTQTFYTQMFAVKKYKEVNPIDPPIDEPSSSITPLDPSSSSASISSSSAIKSNKCGQSSANLLYLMSLIIVMGIIVIKKK